MVRFFIGILKNIEIIHQIYQVTIKLKRRFCEKIKESLLKGAEGRPALPPELVVAIFRFARIAIPAPSLCQTITTHFRVRDPANTHQMHLWFEMRIDSVLLSKLAKVQLVTFSGHQRGAWWPQSCSWFEIAILSKSASEV